MEAALVIYDPDFANGGRFPKSAKAASPATYALNLLTGYPAAMDSAKSPGIGSRIVRALQTGQPVIAFCANNDDGALISGHEWTALSCDLRYGRVTLRNPWGHFKAAGASKGGVLYAGNAEVIMTLRQLAQFITK